MPQQTCPKFHNQTLRKVFRSREFLVQVFDETQHGAVSRLTINRTELDDRGEWRAGISWDELQRIKHCCGYGHCDAVEVFPKEIDVVNVSNMRHLWVVPDDCLKFAWRKYCS